MIIFDEEKTGVVNTGHYKNTMNQFLWMIESDLGDWYYSKTFQTWFKFKEIDFIV